MAWMLHSSTTRNRSAPPVAAADNQAENLLGTTAPQPDHSNRLYFQLVTNAKFEPSLHPCATTLHQPRRSRIVLLLCTHVHMDQTSGVPL